MKKIRFLLVVLCISALCACKKNETQVVPETTSEQVTEAVTEQVMESQEEVTIEEKTIEAMEAEIDELMFHNLYCALYVFVSRNLPPVDAPDAYKESYLYQVDTSMFRDYADFEEYIRSIYVKETADELLNAFPYEGKTKYVNYNGMLCLDTRYEVLEENYIDWYNYEFEVDYIEDKECGFTIYTTITEPSENPVAKEYTVSGKIIWDDGYWYLEEMIY